MTKNHIIDYEKLFNLLNHVVKEDVKLRASFQVDNKFRFIHDRLNLLLEQTKENLATAKEKKLTAERFVEIGDDEIEVYVYLFNAQGLALDTWKKLLKPSVFYEYSVNRPIYKNKKELETVIRSKTNKNQHGFLTIALKRADIQNDNARDSLNSTLLKVREGSLQFNRLISFTHNGADYTLQNDGTLVKKGN